jgi:hypothetical protein
MPSQVCSRIGFRRSPHSCLAVALLLLVCGVAYGRIEHKAVVTSHPDYLEVNVFVSGADPELLFRNLDEGMTARLEYEVRISEPRSSPMRVLGPRMLRELRIVYDLRWDPYRRRFTISTNDGGTYTFSDRTALWQFFFELPGFRVPWKSLDLDNPSSSGRWLVETRVIYEPIVFVPGLGILSLLLPYARQSSTWWTDSVEVVQ